METINKEEVKKFWDGRADEYGKSTFQGITNFADEHKSITMDHIDKTELTKLVRKEKEVLDVGCGVGRLSFWLAKRSKKVIGIDYSDPLIEIAKYEAKKRKIKNVEFYCKSCTDIDLNKKFDLIIVFGLLIYMDEEDVIKTIQQLKQHLGKKGKIILKESVGTSGKYIVNKFSKELNAKYNAIYRTPEEIIKLFENNGLKLKYDKKLYQHRKETGVWLFIFKEN